MTNVAPIRPELLAGKLEKIENFELPRLFDEFVERPGLLRVLCYLQHVSQPRNYTGGLARFASDLIDATGDLIGTTQMHKAAIVRGSYSLSDAVCVVSEIPHSVREDIFGEHTESIEAVVGCRGFSFSTTTSIEEGDVRVEEWGDSPLKEISKGRRAFFNRELCSTLTPVRAKEVCTATAREDLADYLKNVCELPHVGLLPPSPRRAGHGRRSYREVVHGAPWYFVRIADALCAFIDRREKELRGEIAQTAITKLIETWTAKSRRMGLAVMIIGNSRFGKTESVQLEAAMRPGHCRIVQTPPGNTLSDLLREVARSIGLEVGPQANVRALAEKIDYVIRFLKLQLIFDEAQFLLPANYSRNTAPARLNWFRRTLMDQQIPAVLVCTPQSYLPAKLRFVKTTGFAIQQFEERIDKTVNLPVELDEADLLAVARVHFPDLSEDYLHYVVGKTAATERNYVSDIAKIARHALDNARENGRKLPLLADINAAMADVLPIVHAQQPQIPVPVTRRAAPLQRPRKPTAAPLPERSIRPTSDSFSRRETQPLTLSG